MRLTDRFNNTERRGLIIMLLIMAVVVIAALLHTYGTQRPVVVVRDTVTCIVDGQSDSIRPLTSKSKKKRSNKTSTKSTRQAAQHRNPLDEPVPATK